MTDMVTTRRTPTVRSVRLVRVLGTLALAAATALACHHDSDPPPHLEPGEVQPLPPSSGTPVGYLVDNATDLKLSDSQLDKLKQIDSVLANQLDEIETQMRSYSAPPPQSSSGGQMGRNGRMRMGGPNSSGGGMGGGGMGGGGMGGGGGRRGRGMGSGSGSGSAAAPPPRYAADIGKLTEERAADMRDALAQAMALMDPVQRVMARKLLDERGIDVEGGTVKGSAAAGASEEQTGGDDGAPMGSGEP